MSMTLEEAIKHAEYIVNNRKDAISVCWSVRECKQIAEWLRELQERRKQPEIRYLTDVEIASAVGACTIYSANSWIYFARTMHELGLEVIERRTDGEKQSD